MLTSDEVIWGYRYMLGRDPESQATLHRHAQNHVDWRDFRSALFASNEFRTSTPFLPRVEKWVAAEILGGDRLMWLDLSDDYVSRGCLLDAYEPLETEIVRRYLRPADVFVDIGANVGWFTMVASTIVGNKGHVHSFEPRRPTVDYLKRSIVLSGLTDLVTVHDFGLADAPREISLAWEPATRNPGHTYLAAEEAQAIAPVEIQKAEVRRLDDVGIDRVDLIKIDVEGAELMVLRGATRTIESHRPIILSEVYPNQLNKVSKGEAKTLFNWLQERGYRGMIVDSQRYGEQITDFPANWYKELLNVLFIHRDGPRVLPSVET